MKCLRSLVLLSISFITIRSAAQSDNINLNDKQYNILERLEIKLVNDSLPRFTTVKPYNRKVMTQRVEQIYSNYQKGLYPNLELTDVDEVSIKNFLISNADWTTDPKYSFLSKRKPNYTGLYPTSAHLVSVKTKDYSFVMDPIFTIQGGKSTEGNKSLYVNARGVVLRGSVANAIGFYTTLTENQEKDPLYVQEYIANNKALPGYGFFKPYQQSGYDHLDAHGGISVNTGKFFDLLVAYDKLFIGNGYRSLFLSDFSSNYYYLRFKMHIGKVNYESIFAQTTQPFDTITQSVPQALPKNYIGIHHLSWQVSKRFNLGFYENSTENGKNGVKLDYLNPFIIYKSLEQDDGNYGKTSIGFDFRYNAVKNVQFYGQVLFSEFITKEILNYGHGFWENKQGAQLGMKYIDAFGIYNFDLQFEANLVRPYTYTARDSVIGFTNYNQPLAHPLGASFREFIAIAKLQPIPKLYLTAKIFYNEQGLDSAGLNMGSDIFRSYLSRPRDYGFKIGSGILARTMMGSFTASYEVIPGVFIDGNTTYRKYDVQNQIARNDFYFTLGFRFNIARRDFEF